MTYIEIMERRNKLMHDATALARSANITPEQRAQVTAMLKDVDVLEEDGKVAQRLEAFETEQRSSIRPPRGEITDTNVEQQKRAFKNFIVKGETRDLGVVTAGSVTGGSQLVAPAFYPVLTQAQQAYGGLVNIVNQRTTDTGAAMKLSFSSDVSHGLNTWAEDTAASEVDPALSTNSSGTDLYNTGAILVTLEEIQDSYFDIDAFVRDILGQRLYRGLAKWLSQGNSGNFTGFWGAATSGATSAANTGIVYNDVASLYSSLDPAYSANATFVCSSATLGAAFIAATDTLGRPLYIPSPVAGAPDRLLGRPIVLDQYAPSIGASTTPLAFGDFKAGVTLRNVGQFEVARDPYTYLISKGAVAFIGYGRGGSFMTDAGTNPIKVLTMHA